MLHCNKYFMSIESDQKALEKIERQFKRWDFLAKFLPVVFLLISFLFLIFDLAYFDILFLIGTVFFTITTVVWWFWTIFNIRFLARLFRKTTNNLIEVADDLKSIKKEYQDLRNDENNIK